MIARRLRASRRGGGRPRRAAVSALSAAQQPTFRATTALVTVSVSVKRGNAVVANLTAADFRLPTTACRRRSRRCRSNRVPIDVTLFLDTSGSTAGKLDEMQHDVQAILKLLRAGDRFRLLTIGDAVDLAVPWVAGGHEGDRRDRAGGRHLADPRRADVRAGASPRAGPAPSHRRDDRPARLRQRGPGRAAARHRRPIGCGDAPGGLFGRRR